MPKPMITIHNVETDEIVTREMTNEEFKVYQIQQEEQAAIEAKEADKIAAKTALLERLGISEEEAKLLLA